MLKYTSKPQINKYGVPQGSILGPLLFICYLKDMPKCLSKNNELKTKLCVYADASNLIISAKTEIELEINTFIELSKIQEFSLHNNLILNTQKTIIEEVATIRAYLPKMCLEKTAFKDKI